MFRTWIVLLDDTVDLDSINLRVNFDYLENIISLTVVDCNMRR